MLPSQLEFSAALAACYAVSIYAFMLLLSRAALRVAAVREVLTPPSQRYGALDGLRGVLAAGVFVHHSFAAYGYFTTGRWAWSTSPILNQLGQSTVAMFFMITGFLFTRKAQAAHIDWRPFYRARVARLAPLHTLVVLAVFVLVFALSDFTLRESPLRVLSELVAWLAFVLFKRPDVNGYADTWTLIAGVNWSLRYELLFYALAVPGLHLVARRVSARVALIACALAMGGLLVMRELTSAGAGHTLYLTHFGWGMLAAYLHDEPTVRALFERRAFRFVACVAAGALLSFEHSYGALAGLCAFVVFAAVLNGASMAGLLQRREAIWLGDVSYGIYLLHGLLLWLTLAALRASGSLATLNLHAYWLIVLGVAALVVLLASASYVLLEKPFMARVAAQVPERARGLAAPAE